MAGSNPLPDPGLDERTLPVMLLTGGPEPGAIDRLRADADQDRAAT